MKGCKVITAWFGERRDHGSNSPLTGEAAYDLIRTVINTELTLDPGVSLDTVIINHGGPYIRGTKYLHSMAGSKTPRGHIIVHDQPNIGASFGGYHQAYSLYKDHGYTHWSFFEDDVIITKELIFKEAFNQLDTNENLAFVSLPPIAQVNPHAPGGCGFTKTRFLEMQWREFGCLIHAPKEVTAADMMPAQRSEEWFTFCFVRRGFKIENLKGYSPYPSNWEKHIHQKGTREYRKDDNGNYIYQVGL